MKPLHQLIAGLAFGTALVAGTLYIKSCNSPKQNKPTINISVDPNYHPQDSYITPSSDATSTDSSNVDTNQPDLESRLPSDEPSSIPTTVTPTDCSNDTYKQIKSIVDSSTLTNTQKNESLVDVLTAYITQHGGEVIVPVGKYISTTKDPKKVCQGGLDTLYTLIVGEEQSTLDLATKTTFTTMLTPYLCDTKNVTANKNYPYLRLKSTN